MAYDLQKHGLSGVVNGRCYTAWWIGACDDTSWLHNVIGILSEAASVRVATPHLHRAERDPDGLSREAHGLRRPLAGRLVAAARPRRLRARPVEEPDQDGRPPQGGPAVQLLPDVQELDREGRQGPALRLRHPGRPARLSDDAQDARGPEDGRGRDPSGQGRLHRRRPVLHGRVVRGQDGPALQDLRLGPARKAEISRHAAVPRRPPDPALRQRGLDPAPPDGRRLRRGRGALRSQAREDRRRPLPPRSPARARRRLFRPGRAGQRLLRHGRFALLKDKAEVWRTKSKTVSQGPRPPGRELRRQELARP